MRHHRWVGKLAVIAALCVVAPAALACPVCGGGGQNAHAFITTMVFLSAMPLMMVGGGVGFVWYLARQAAKEEATEDAGKVIYLGDRSLKPGRAVSAEL